MWKQLRVDVVCELVKLFNFSLRSVFFILHSILQLTLLPYASSNIVLLRDDFEKGGCFFKRELDKLDVEINTLCKTFFRLL